MSRKQTAIVNCDSPNCKSYEEVENLNVSPPGWYKMWQINSSGATSGNSSSFDLCSLPCVSKWARDRKSSLIASGVDPSIMNSPAKTSKNPDENRELVLTAIQQSDHPMRASELARILGMVQSTIDRHINTLMVDGKVVVENVRDKSPTGWVRLYTAT